MTSFSICAAGLTRRFGDMTAVHSLDLQVPEGGVYGFLGPNGSGKTTTIRMLLGLLRPHAGEVEIFGHNLAKGRRSALRQLGALVEHPSLYAHLTGRENLEVSRRLLGLERSRIDQVLGMVGLMPAAEKVVSGYSLGMRQRLGLALALLPQPRLLILDEPTNGLDPKGLQEMRDLLLALASDHGVTIFLSSHQLSEIEQVADTIAIVTKGRLRFEGSMAQLRSEMRSCLHVATDRPEEARQLLNSEGWVTRQRASFLEIFAGDSELTVDSCAAGGVAELLVQRSFRIHHLSVKEPSLESLFLHVTQNGAGHDSLDRQEAEYA